MRHTTRMISSLFRQLPDEDDEGTERLVLTMERIGALLLLNSACLLLLLGIAVFAVMVQHPALAH